LLQKLKYSTGAVNVTSSYTKQLLFAGTVWYSPL